MKKVKVFAAGKINLSLNILGRQGNMHLIDSIMLSIDIGDIVCAALRSDNQVNISFEGCSLPHNNTVQKTVDYMRQRFGDFGVDIVVQKALPIAYGLGGSAADIAATLVALSYLLGLDKKESNLNDNNGNTQNNAKESSKNSSLNTQNDKQSLSINNQKAVFDLYKAAAELGSDVPFLLKGGCVRVGGIGEILTDIDNKLDFNIVLASGAKGCSSKDAYARFDTLTPTFCDIKSDNNALVAMLKSEDVSAVRQCGNALTNAAESLCGNIESVRARLLKHGAINAVMTGSGSAVAGFFESQAESQRVSELLKGEGLYAIACKSSNVGTRFL